MPTSVDQVAVSANLKGAPSKVHVGFSILIS